VIEGQGRLKDGAAVREEKAADEIEGARSSAQ